jgi:RecA-family ATPase
MSEQVDIAVALGAVPQPLPEIVSLRQFAENPPLLPPLVIEGVLHKECKMILGGTSKSNKSWCLLDLAISVASGQPWWGRKCTKMAVLYINFELHGWAMAQRIQALAVARPECQDLGDTLHIWNLRGHNADLTLLRPKLEEQIAKHEFGLIILDPAYKVLGGRDENANGDIQTVPPPHPGRVGFPARSPGVLTPGSYPASFQDGEGL